MKNDRSAAESLDDAILGYLRTFKGEVQSGYQRYDGITSGELVTYTHATPLHVSESLKRLQKRMLVFPTVENTWGAVRTLLK